MHVVRISAIMLSACLTAMCLYGANIDIASKIVKATVYPQGATVYRTAQAKVPAGTHTLRFYGLSTGIDPNSIRFKASGNYTVQSVSYRYDYLSPHKDPKSVKTLLDSLQILNDEMAVLSGERYAYDQELSFITNNKTIGSQQVVPQSEEFGKMAEMVRVRIWNIRKALHAIDLKERGIKKAYTRIETKIGVLRGDSPKPVGIIEIQVMAAMEWNSSVELSFFTQYATWYPSYDFRFMDTDKPISANYMARVSQSTGVDWEGVMLTLSTTSPRSDNNKPYLHPWVLQYQRIYYEEAAAARGARSKSLESLDNVYEDAGYEPAGIALADSYTTAIQTMLSVDFVVDLPYNIPSDGQVRAITLRTFGLKADFVYYAAPKVDADAFLIAYISDWAKEQLLPGPSNIFMGDAYMGASFLQPGYGRDTLEIAFGRDKMVQLKREMLQGETKKSVLSGKRRHEFAFETTVRNLHKSEIKLVLEDQIPIPQFGTDIEVIAGNLGGATHNIKSGLLTWELTMPANAVEVRKFSFEIRHNAKEIVEPLPY